MNIIKILLTATLLSLLLSCGDKDQALVDDAMSKLDKEFSIKAAFGITIGVVSEGLPEGYVIENKVIPFTPDKADQRFVQYEYSTTPKSHIIYSIEVKSPRELSKENCFEQRNQLIEKTLHALGSNTQLKVSEEKNKWKIREYNQRQITIDCETSITPDELQLVMIYQDNALSLLAFKEWKKRQTEITLIRF
ncbi:MAG: hypothetical protein JKX87_03555 [Cycloclasticus sp.]|nr:hypothetical protein [Cycloclasticus sp.]